MTVVTTAPSYLFWRCAPPELRVPRELSCGAGRAWRPHGGRRAARLGDAGGDAAQARRRRRGTRRMRGGRRRLASRQAWDTVAAVRDAHAGELRIVTRPGQAAASSTCRRCTGRTAGWPATTITTTASTTRRPRPRRRGGGVARLPLPLQLLRQDRLPRRLPPARAAAAAGGDRRTDRPGRRLRLFHRRDLPAATAAAGGAGRPPCSSACRPASTCGSRDAGAARPAGCVSIEAGVESLTVEGRAALDKRCRMTTDDSRRG